MFIPQNTTIHILKGIPLNSDYENTVYYTDINTQVKEFLKYKQYSLENYSYQRANMNCIKVQLPYEALYQCNYLMFKNTNFENKWFFCFIENIAYVSNNVTAIYYKVDTMQTWCYDYHFLSTFVDRHHSKHDLLFDNIQPEGMDLGQYYKPIAIRIASFRDDIHFVIIMSDIVGIPNIGAPGQGGTLLETADLFSNGGELNGVMNSLFLITFPWSRRAEMQKFLRAVNDNGKGNTIVNFYVAPCSLKYNTTRYQSFIRDGALGNYTPKNKKLYNSPYHIIQLENNQGQSVILNPEQIGGTTLKYTLQLISYPEAGARIYPENYLGLGNGIDYSCVYMSFPICSFATNVYAMWWSQNKNSYMQSLAAIDASYDTNTRIIQNNYAMANRNARANMQAASTGNAAQLAAAQGNIESARRNYTDSANFAIHANTGKGAVGIVTNLLNGDFGNAASEGMTIDMANRQNALDYHNQMRSLGTQAASAIGNSAAAQANAQLAYDTAMENNATNYANNNLTNLTNKNNATNALMAKKRDIENIPNTAKINASADSLNWAFNNANFYINEYCLKEDYMKRVDDYFTAYGYSQCRLYPGSTLDERINRQHYSYLKTVGCNITGNLNDQDLNIIRSIYDNGITTWDTLENVGNYEIENGTK